MQLVTSSLMRDLDHGTIETIGIPGMVLMENAGRGTVTLMEKHYGPVSGKYVIIFVGPGNNGGDGLVIARTILNKGAHPYILFLVDPNTLKGDAAHNYKIIQQLDISYKIIDSQEKLTIEKDAILSPCDKKAIHSIVDSIFGIGLDREVTGHFAKALELINHLKQRYKIPVVAADIPSGMNANTGEILGKSICADLTVTYGLGKPAHFHNGGTGVGILEIVDIGIPPLLQEKMQLPDTEALTFSNIPILAEKRLSSHKGTNGHVAIIAGSEGKTGAAILNAKAAIHTNSGLITLFAPSKLNPVYETALIEAMSIPLPHSSTCISIDDYDLITATLADKDSIVIGPGLDTKKQTAEMVLRIYEASPLPMVVDADALNILAKNKLILSNPGGPRIFTPHPGEMARLIDTNIKEIQADRTEAVQKLNNYCRNAQYPVVTILKGAGTVISSSDNQLRINTTGNPGMGAGGMGDVLAGIIGSLLAQGYSTWEASCLGVFMHGLSADILARSTPYGYSATDVAVNLPHAINEILHHQR